MAAATVAAELPDVAAALPGAPEALPVLSLVDLRAALRRQYTARQWVRAGVLGMQVAEALERHGALVLELPPDEAATLKEALGASDALFGGSEGPATQLVGGKALAEYRSGADVPTVPAGVAPSAERAHACLVAAGRDISFALSTARTRAGQMVWTDSLNSMRRCSSRRARPARATAAKPLPLLLPRANRAAAPPCSRSCTMTLARRRRRARTAGC